MSSSSHIFSSFNTLIDDSDITDISKVPATLFQCANTRTLTPERTKHAHTETHSNT